MAGAPSAAILGAWSALAIAGEPIVLPVAAVALVTAVAFLVAAVLGIRRIRRLAPPSIAVIDRRLEIASALPHRPLAALRDRAATTGVLAAGSGTLWSAHQARAAGRLEGLRAGWPRPAIAAIDRWRLRFAIPALLVLAVAGAGAQSGALLLAALLPGVAAAPGPAGRIEAWITPPAFSGMAPVFLHEGDENPSAVPAGSRLSVVLTGSEAKPRLVFEGRRNGKPRFHRLAASSWQAGAVLVASTRLVVRQGGHRVGAWTVTVVPVDAPDIAWAAPPGAWRGGWRTRLPWSARDRFGVTTLRAELRPVRPAGAPPITVPIPLAGEPKQASGTELPDLTSSPFAGTEVDATLVASNSAGVAGRSPTVRFTLPARPFRDPLARAVLAVRRRLALDPGARRASVSDLETLGDVPGAFDDRLGIFLNLESVAALLAVDPGAGAVEDAQARLWQLALQIEDQRREGGAAAERNVAVEAARNAVDRQIARMRELGTAGRTPSEQAELARRLQALRQALASRMAALTRQALRQGLVLPPDAGRAALGPDAFERMMRTVEKDASSGHVDDAARALSRMEDLLDRMRPATADDVRRALAARAADAAAQADMAAVADMVRREASLLDRAEKRQNPPNDAARADRSGAGDLPPSLFRVGPDGRLEIVPPQPSPSAPPPGGAASNRPDQGAETARREQDRKVQHALGRAAGALTEQFGALSGKPPPGLGRAGEAMGRAETALKQGDDRAAASAENEALRDLQQGGRDMQQAMRSGGGSGGSGAGGGALVPGFASGGSSDGGDDGHGGSDDGGQGQQAGRDPLGRSLDGQGKGAADDTELAIHGNDANAESRAIEEELRRRDSDRQRPHQELDYLGRLLQAF